MSCSGYEARGGHERPNALEEQEAPLRVDVREDGEYGRSNEIEHEVEIRVLVEPADLRARERRKDQQCAANLNDLVYNRLPF